MGVYFPGMKMPTNCAECPVNMEYCKKGYEYLLEHPELYDKRADDCPLIYVPKHGRLGDLDELYKEAFERSETKAGYYNCLDYVISCYTIDQAPTIIPASEEGNTKPLKEE